MLCFSVDDLIIAGFSDAAFSNVKKYLAIQFKIKELGLINGRLPGLNIKLTDEGIIICMATHIKVMLANKGLAECRRKNPPMMLNPYKLVVQEPGEERHAK